MSASGTADRRSRYREPRDGDHGAQHVVPGQTVEVRTEPTADGYVRTRIARAGDAVEAVGAIPPLDVAARFAAPAT